MEFEQPYFKGMPTMDRLLLQSEFVTESGCRIWLGSEELGGYGGIRFNGHTRRTHRVMFELINGPVPAGVHVCHRCDVPQCINPDHLFIGTPSENALDSVAKGRHPATQRTHCPRGHSFENNVIIGKRPNGRTYRKCLECSRTRAREYQRKRFGYKAAIRRGEQG